MNEPILKGVPLSVVVAAYQRHQSVHRAGRELGLVGQSVHRFLLRHGYPVNKAPVFTEAELLKIEIYYKTSGMDFDLDVLATKMNRQKTSIVRIARELGLTDQSRMTSRMLRALQENGKVVWKNNPHPRGFLGGKHSTETKARISKSSKQSWVTAKAFGIGPMSPENRQRRSEGQSVRMQARPASNVYSKARRGYRTDLGIFVRSAWEANYARYLNLLKKMRVVEDWQYEPKTFWFNGPKRGTLSYKPDFRVIYRHKPKPEYVEIKGWVTRKDRTKWARMKKYHPEIQLVVLGEKEYLAIRRKWASAIPEWEYGEKQRAPLQLKLRPIRS